MTETVVSYHRDGLYEKGRPAINVKVHAAGLDFWPDVFRRMDGDPLFQERDFSEIDRAQEIVFGRFWHDAEVMAEELGLGPIEQEGRSGGWLVFTDGRDPQTMDDDHVCRCGHWQAEHYLPADGEPGGCEGCAASHPDEDASEHGFEVDPEADTLAAIADRGGDPAAWPRHVWLAAYLSMAAWCDMFIADAPAKVAALAQSLAIDAAGERTITLRSWLAWGKEYAL